MNTHDIVRPSLAEVLHFAPPGLGLSIGFGAAGAPAFSPATLSGLAALYDPASSLKNGSGVAPMDGDAIAEWDDSSGTGDANKNTSQATAAKRPTYTASNASFNHKPTLGFLSASAQYLQSPAWAAAIASPFTIFLVGADDGTASAQAFYSDTTGAPADIVIQSSSSKYILYNGGTFITGPSVSSAPKVFVGVYNGASSRLYVSAKTAAATGAVGTTAFNGITLGAVRAGTSNLNGTLAYLAVYSGAKSDADCGKLLAWAGSTFGITIGA